MAHQVQNLFKFKNFYDQVNFDACQCLKVIELTGSLGGLGLILNRPHGGRRFKDSAKVFYEKNRKILPSYLNRLLQVTSYFELEHVLIDPGSSLYIMPPLGSRQWGFLLTELLSN